MAKDVSTELHFIFCVRGSRSHFELFPARCCFFFFCLHVIIVLSSISVKGAFSSTFPAKKHVK